MSVLKEKQKFHFCFKDFGQRESLGCWSAATAIRGLWSKRISGMLERSDSNPWTLVKENLWDAGAQHWLSKKFHMYLQNRQYFISCK
jgi:hypothetical protein